MYFLCKSLDIYSPNSPSVLTSITAMAFRLLASPGSKKSACTVHSQQPLKGFDGHFSTCTLCVTWTSSMRELATLPSMSDTLSADEKRQRAADSISLYPQLALKQSLFHVEACRVNGSMSPPNKCHLQLCNDSSEQFMCIFKQRRQLMDAN